VSQCLLFGLFLDTKPTPFSRPVRCFPKATLSCSWLSVITPLFFSFFSPPLLFPRRFPLALILSAFFSLDLLVFFMVLFVTSICDFILFSGARFVLLGLPPYSSLAFSPPFLPLPWSPDVRLFFFTPHNDCLFCAIHVFSLDLALFIISIHLIFFSTAFFTVFGRASWALFQTSGPPVLLDFFHQVFAFIFFHPLQSTFVRQHGAVFFYLPCSPPPMALSLYRFSSFCSTSSHLTGYGDSFPSPQRGRLPFE